MSNILFANNARTILSSAINNSTTILPVSSTTGFPTISGGDYFYVTLDDGSNIEIVKVTATTSNTFTVVRAQDGTSAHSFAATTTRVENRLNAGVIFGFVPKTGATMTGTLTLNGNAVGNYDAVPLQQLVNSPGFLGTPTAPTAAPGTNTTQLATTAFVTNAVSTGSSKPYWGYFNAATRSTAGNIDYQSGTVNSGITGYSSGVVTIATTGIYFVSASATIGYHGGYSGASAFIDLYLNGNPSSIRSYWGEQNNTTELGVVSFSIIISLSAGDTISIYFDNTAQTSCSVESGYGTFSGFKI